MTARPGARPPGRPPRARAHRIHRAPAVLVAVLLLLTPLLGGCFGKDDSPSAAERRSEQRAAIQVLLDHRAAAVRDGRLPAFLATLDRHDHALVARQRRYFANLRELPVARFGYRVLDRSWSDLLAARRWGRVVMPQVQVTLQLKGYDAVPVSRLTGFAFRHTRQGWRIVADRTKTGAFFPGTQPGPWEITRIRVRHSADVLGIYDRRSYADSAIVNRAVADGIDDVEAVLPFSWNGRVVVYEFRDQRVLHSFDNVPGGNIAHLGAMTFPVYVDPGGARTASSRFVLMPGSVVAGQPFLGRITRHELTHVALAGRDDGVPTWFAEGIAEYVGARDIQPSQRRIATVAVARARSGVSSLPASRTFNGPDQEWNYALSWMACDWIADHQGESRLWALMRALHADGRGTPDDRQDAVLRRVLGFDGRALAARAAQRIVDIYG